MLIKKQKIRNLGSHSAVPVLEFDEEAKISQIEVQKAKQEARIIRQEAQQILVEAQKELKDAETKANEIIQNADKEAIKIKESTYHKTLQAAKEEIDNLRNDTQNLLYELFEVKREALLQAHKEIINIALNLAEKIIKYQVSIDTNVLKTQVVDAIKKATSEADRVQVFVNPADLKILEDTIPEMKKLFPTGIDIILLSDDSVDSGSCIVETKSGQLDATFATQLKTLTNLTSKLEIKAPQIGDDLLIPEEEVLEAEPLIPDETEEIALTEEENELKEELLGNELLIEIPEEAEFPFTSQEETLTETTEEKEEKTEEDNEILEVPESIAKDILKEESSLSQERKKLPLEDFPERTKEEIEELEELEEFDFEEDEELEEKEETTSIKDVLRPKKKPKSDEISRIASEIEDSPEWKDLVQDEEDE